MSASLQGGAHNAENGYETANGVIALLVKCPPTPVHRGTSHCGRVKPWMAFDIGRGVLFVAVYAGCQPHNVW
jgi:hypothetical protein